MVLFFLSWIFLVASLAGSMAMTAFDCVDKPDTLKTLDLVNVEACPEPTSRYNQGENVTVQVTQVIGSVWMSVTSCSVSMSSSVFRCGFDSISYGTTWILWNEPVIVSASECRKAYEGGDMVIGGKRTKINVNSSTVIFEAANGVVEASGYCKGESFSVGGVDYIKTVRQNIYTVRVEKRSVESVASSNMIRVSNRLICPLTDLSCADDMEGVFVWDRKEGRCGDLRQTVFLGRGMYYRLKNSSEDHGVLLIRNEVGQQYAGFYSSGKKYVCGYDVRTTQTEGMYFAMGVSLKDLQSYGGDRKVSIVSLHDISTTVGYASISLHMAIDAVLSRISSEFCEARRSLLKTNLEILRHHPDGNVLSLLGYKRSKAVIAGVTAYISECTPVSVTIRDSSLCYQEIPVSQNGTTAFVDPITMILQTNGTVATCSPLTPIMWEIMGIWYCSTPNILKCVPPQKLVPLQSDFSRALGSVEGYGSGIYSPADRKSYAAHMNEQGARRATVGELTQILRYGNLEGSNYAMIFNAHSIGELAESLRPTLFPLLGWLGSMMNYVVGIYVLVGWMTMAISCLVRVVVIYRMKGCGWHIVAAAASSLFMAVYYPLKVARSVASSTLAPLLEIQKPDIKNQMERDQGVELRDVPRFFA